MKMKKYVECFEFWKWPQKLRKTCYTIEDLEKLLTHDFPGLIDKAKEEAEEILEDPEEYGVEPDELQYVKEYGTIPIGDPSIRFIVESRKNQWIVSIYLGSGSGAFFSRYIMDSSGNWKNENEDD